MKKAIILPSKFYVLYTDKSEFSKLAEFIGANWSYINPKRENHGAFYPSIDGTFQYGWVGKDFSESKLKQLGYTKVPLNTFLSNDSSINDKAYSVKRDDLSFFYYKIKDIKIQKEIIELAMSNPFLDCLGINEELANKIYQHFKYSQPELLKSFNELIKDFKNVKVDETYMLFKAKNGLYKNISYILDDKYDWEIKPDATGCQYLIPNKKL